MEIRVLEDLVVIPVSRDYKAPWLNKDANKIKLFLDFTFQVTSAKHNVDDTFIIPKDYVSDWSTIPRVVWPLYPPNYTEARRGSVAHDYIYSHLYNHYTKSFADDLLKAFMTRDGAPWLSRWIFRVSTGWGGKGGWYYKERSNADPHWLIHHEKLHYSSNRSFFDEVFAIPR